MCRLCDNIRYGENLEILNCKIDLANRSNLVTGNCTIYKNDRESDAVMSLWIDLCGHSSETAMVIKYCPICGKNL